MTIIKQREIECEMCHSTSIHRVLSSTNSSGYSDLDTRPNGMARSVIFLLVMECPHCGYVGFHLKCEGDLPMDFLKSEEYRTCSGIDFKSKTAQMFYRKYLISTQLDNLKIAMHDLLRCAWACDDKKDNYNAELIRKIAADIARILIERDDDERDDIILIRADLLRRSREFEKLIGEYDGISLDDEVKNKTLTFQIEKARKGDDLCYTYHDVIGGDEYLFG